MMRASRILLIVAALSSSAPTWAQWSGTGNYTGPSILSRGARPAGRSGGQPVRLRGYANLGAMYTSGLGVTGTDAAGNIFNQDSLGASIGFGLSGSKQSRRSTTTMAWGGGYNLYTNNQHYSGANQSLSLSHEHQLTRRWSIQAGLGGQAQSVALSGQRTNLPFADENFAPVFDTSAELFDGRMITGGGQIGATYTANQRLSFAMSGSVFATNRNSQALASARGYSATGETSYALNRVTSVGASYNYGNYFFPRGFGRSDVHSWMGQFSRVLTRRWTFSGGLGRYRAESQRIQAVQLDPFVARLIGQSSSIEVVHNISGGLAASAGLTGVYRRGSVNVGYTRGISPGNGLFLTSRQDAVYASFASSIGKRLNWGVSANFLRLSQLFDATSLTTHFDAWNTSAGIAYRIASVVHLTASADYRYSLVGTTLPNDFTRGRYAISVGLAFSPGELPLQLW